MPIIAEFPAFSLSFSNWKNIAVLSMEGDKNLARLYNNQINSNNNGMAGFINWNSSDA